MLDSVFQRLMLSQFCICASGKKTQKGKCSVYSTRASPLLLFNAERSCCFHKGVLKVSFAEQRPAVWRRGTGDQKENFWIPEGLCSWVKAMQVKCWHWCPQGHCPTSERLQSCTAEGFFPKNEPHSLQNPPPPANSIPAGTQPPAASAAATLPPPTGGKIPSQHTNYRLS